MNDRIARLFRRWHEPLRLLVTMRWRGSGERRAMLRAACLLVPLAVALVLDSWVSFVVAWFVCCLGIARMVGMSR